MNWQMMGKSKKKATNTIAFELSVIVYLKKFSTIRVNSPSSCDHPSNSTTNTTNTSHPICLGESSPRFHSIDDFLPILGVM